MNHKQEALRDVVTDIKVTKKGDTIVARLAVKGRDDYLYLNYIPDPNKKMSREWLINKGIELAYHQVTKND